MACETAGSLTPSADAAALTVPSRATSTNALSWVKVTFRFCAGEAPSRQTRMDQRGYGASEIVPP